MDTICCIIDLDGFPLNGRFLTRELGWINMANGRGGSIRFNLQPYMNEVNSSNRNGIDFLTENVHGLTFEPMPGEPTIAHDNLLSKVLEIYNDCKNCYKNVVAYKGGQQEKTLLKNLNIPSINLETLGCPKYDDLKHTRCYNSDTCGYHVENLHCPKAEVATFRNWMIHRFG